MESWLLLIIAALVTGCFVLYCHLRQVESAAAARETLFAEELDELREQMQAMSDRLQRLEPAVAQVRKLANARPARETPWQARVLQLARTGMKPREIAREMELSLSEVELALVFPIRLPDE